MADPSKTIQELCTENTALKKRIEELETAEVERKHAEKSLSNSHQTFFTVLDGVEATIYATDMDTYEILFMNKYMIDAFGADFTGRICYEVFRKEDSPCGHCTNDQLLDTHGNPTGVCIWETKNPITGKWYINYDRAIPWVDGRMVKLQIATDINERKQAEDALKESRANLLAILENTNDIIASYDREVRLVAFNQACRRIYQTLFGIEIRPGLRTIDLLPEEQRGFWDAKNARALAGESFQVEFNEQTADGKKLFFESSFNPIWYGSKVIGFSTMTRDITERKRTEEALLLRDRAIASSINAIVIADLNGSITYVNDAFTRMWGYTAAEASGMPVTRLGSSDEEVEKFISQFRIQGHAIGESIAKRKDGSPFHIQVSGSLVLNETGEPQAMLSSFVDITDRKRTEEELRESEERYRNFVRNATEGIYRIDFLPPVPLDLPERELMKCLAQNAIVGEVNECLTRMYGLSATDMIGRRATDFAPTYGERALLVRRAPNFQVRDQETEDVNPNGQTVSLLENFTGVVEDGHLIHIWGMQRDITDRKRAEEELRVFMESVDNSSDAVGMSTPEGKHYYQNRAFDELFGPVGENPRESVYVDPAVGHDVFRAIMAGEQWTGEVQMYAKDRRILDIFLRAYANKDKSGRITALVGIHTDITIRKQAENALNESEDRFSRAIAGTGAGLWDWDIVNDRVYFSPQWKSMLGYEDHEVEDAFSGWKNLWHPEDASRIEKAVNDYLQGRTSVYEVEHRLRHKDGSWHWILTRGDIHWDAAGRPVRWVGTNIDITERKRTDEARFDALARFSGFTDASQYGMGMADLDGRITFANATLARMLGEKTAEDCLGKHFPTAYYSPSMTQKLQEEVLPTLMSVGYWHGELEIQTVDGRSVPTEENYFVIRDEQGRIRNFADILTDTTDRKRAEDRLRDSESKYQFLAESMADVVFTLALDLTTTYVSPSVEKMLGFSPAERMAQSVDQQLTPESLKLISDILLTEMEREKDPGADPNRSLTLELEYFHKDGSVRNLETYIRGIRDNKGNLTGIYGSHHDMTERKRIDEALRNSEENYRQLFNNSPSAIYQIDFRTGKFLKANDVVCEYLGCSQKEITSLSPYDLMTDESKRLLLKRLTKIDLGEKIEENPEYEIVDKNEKHRWIQLNSKNIFNAEGLVIGADVVAHEITDQKKAEEESRRLASVVRHSREVVSLATPDGTMVFLNDAGKEILGICEEDIARTNVMDVIPKHHRDKVRQEVLPLIIGEEGYWEGELQFLNVKTGGLTDVHVKAYKIVDPETGALQFLSNVSQDITDRKRAEEEKRRLEERLQRSEKMEALGQLAGGVAHDLNNVLGILSGYSELLLLETPEGSRSRGHAEKILQSTEKGAAIIQDLLTLARRGVTASDVINLNSVVSDFLKSPVFEKMKDYHPRVTFRTECDKNLLNIKGSPVHLEKTLINLLSNAAESISGEGEVTIRTESRYLDKAIRGCDEVKEGDYAVLTVSDTGMGIPAENREKIFEPFYTKKTMGRSGTGLGLAIVWGTVKDHNGYIDLQTEVGTGTTFALNFPVTREELIAQQQKVPIERYMGKGESVLVVDDIAEQRDVASGLLARLGYEVHVVSSGEEAVEYLKRNKADILVLDMIMTPGIDGLETYQRVLEINPRQKAILVSGFSETDRVKEAQGLGAGAYVKKPYVMEKIGIAILDELNR